MIVVQYSELAYDILINVSIKIWYYIFDALDNKGQNTNSPYYLRE